MQNYKCLDCGEKKFGYGNNPSRWLDDGKQGLVCDVCNQKVIFARFKEIENYQALDKKMDKFMKDYENKNFRDKKDFR